MDQLLTDVKTGLPSTCICKCVLNPLLDERNSLYCPISELDPKYLKFANRRIALRHRHRHWQLLDELFSNKSSSLASSPKYAQSILSAHDHSFDVEVRRERLPFSAASPSSSEKHTSGAGASVVHHLTAGNDDVGCLVRQLDLALPGIRLKERLLALERLCPQTIMDFLVDIGHLNTITLDLLRLSDVDKVVFPRSFFDRENGLNLRGNEIFTIFGKPDAFRSLTRLAFSGIRLVDSDIIHFHHLPKLSILLLDETGISNEAVFLLVPLKGTLSILSIASNPDVDNDALPAIFILRNLSYLSIPDTSIDMVGLRRMAEVINQEKRVIRIRLPAICEDYIQSLGSKHLTELKPPLISEENGCENLSIHALRRNLQAHANHNPSILATGTKPEMVHRLRKILKIRRLDRLVMELLS